MRHPLADFSIICAILVFSGPWIQAEDKNNKSTTPKESSPNKSDVQSIQEEAVVLLTGFEPFGGRPINSSWEAVRAFKDQRISGHKIVVAPLPVVYDELASPLQQAISDNKPAIIISFGEGHKDFRVECYGRNGYHPQNPPDNKGRKPPRTKINPEGPAQYKTELPIHETVENLSKSGFDAIVSMDAGGYLCNECLFRLLEAPSGKGKDRIQARGFVHVPIIGTMDSKGKPHTVERLRDAVRIIIETVIRSKGSEQAAKPEKEKKPEK